MNGVSRLWDYAVLQLDRKAIDRVDPPASSLGRPDWNVQVSNGGSGAGETGPEKALRPSCTANR